MEAIVFQNRQVILAQRMVMFKWQIHQVLHVHPCGVGLQADHDAGSHFNQVNVVDVQ